MVEILELCYYESFFGEIFVVKLKFLREFIEFANSSYFNFFGLAAIGLLEVSRWTLRGVTAQTRGLLA